MIIKSMLDTDWYKITMAQVVYFFFSEYEVKYSFINRGGVKFPAGFDLKLKEELAELEKLSLTQDELLWLLKQNSIYTDFALWFKDYKFNSKEVIIDLKDGDLSITIEGDWLRTIFWEVPLLAIISELFFKEKGCILNIENFKTKCENKKNIMKFSFADFGTRRRFSSDSQNIMINTMSNKNKNFLGTSNPYFAMKYGLTPIGTYAHEAVMAMQYKEQLSCNHLWISAWQKVYGKQYSIMLTDTLTTRFFLKHVTALQLRMMDGVRIDSGSPRDIGYKIIETYQRLHIDTKLKKFIWSDNLNPESAYNLNDEFKNLCIPIFGIGTNLTNDCGFTPLNMVIKLVSVFNKQVIKLSDDPMKYTGDNRTIKQVIHLMNE